MDRSNTQGTATYVLYDHLTATAASNIDLAEEQLGWGDAYARLWLLASAIC
jgi:hypothetical protein